MTLQKIDPRTIEFNDRLQVYRAIPQGFVESDIFYRTNLGGLPSYMARTGIGGTFVTNDFLSGLGYARDWAALMDSKEVPPPFTHYLAFLGIDVKPYSERLYCNPPNEGIVIAGPIDLDDVEVLFCAAGNRLKGLDLDSVVLPSRLSKGGVGELFQQRKEDLEQMADEPPAETFVTRYCQDSERVEEQVHRYLMGQNRGGRVCLAREEIAPLLPKVVSLFE